jgi:hypothetical protein
MGLKRELEEMRETLRMTEARARVTEAAATAAAATLAAAKGGAGGGRGGDGSGDRGDEVGTSRAPYIDPKHHQLLIGQSHRFRAEIDRLKRLDEVGLGTQSSAGSSQYCCSILTARSLTQATWYVYSHPHRSFLDPSHLVCVLSSSPLVP